MIMKIKKGLNIALLVFVFLFLYSNFSFSQEVIVKMKIGKEIYGTLLSLTTDQVIIDPNGQVTYISFSSKELESLTFSDGMKLIFPITQEMIPEKYRNKKQNSSKGYSSNLKNTFLGGTILGVSSSKWTGESDKFADVLTQGVILELENSGFENVTGIDFKNKSRIGLTLSFYLEQRLYKGIFIHPELAYTMQGTRFVTKGEIKFKYDYEYYTADMNQVLSMATNYFHIPVLLVYRFGDETEWRVKPFLQFGPYGSYLVVSKIKTKVTIDDESDSDEEKNDMIKKVDYGLTFGIGLDVLTDKDKVNGVRFEFRYELGLNTLIKDEYNDGFIMRNRLFSINFGIKASI